MLEDRWRSALEELKTLAEAGGRLRVGYPTGQVAAGRVVLATGTNVAGTDLDGRFR